MARILQDLNRPRAEVMGIFNIADDVKAGDNLISSFQQVGYGGDHVSMLQRDFDPLLVGAGGTLHLGAALLPLHHWEQIYPTSYLYEKPREILYNWGEDHKLYGSLLGTMGHAQAALSKLKPKRVERGVQHTTLQGDVYYPMQTFAIRTTKPCFNGQVDLLSFNYAGAPNKALQDGSVDHEDASLTWTSGSLAQLSVLLDYIKYTLLDEKEEWHVTGISNIHNPAPTKWRFSDCDYFFNKYGDLVATYSYLYRHEASNGWSEMTVSTTMTVHFSQVYNAAIPYATLTAYQDYTYDKPPIGMPVTFQDQFTPGDGLDYTNGPIPWPGSQPEWFYTHWLRSQHMRVESRAFVSAIVNGVDRQSLTVNIRKHELLVEQNMSHIYDSAYVSAGNAVEKYTSFVESNFLESAVELKAGIASFMPRATSSEAFMAVLEHAFKMKIAHAALRFVDLLSDSYLFYKFGYEPFIRDSHELGMKIDRIFDVLQNRLGRTSELRGRFDFDFPNGDPLEGLYLTTRSKLVVGHPPNIIAKALMPMEMAGVGLSLANLWDIVPFSFVIDWFTNISQRLSLADSALFMCVTPLVYCVNSYTIQSKPGLNVTDIDMSDNSYIKYYERRVSKFYPWPNMRTRYDWLTNTSFPEILGGSFLWSTFRS